MLQFNGSCSCLKYCNDYLIPDYLEGKFDSSNLLLSKCCSVLIILAAVSLTVSWLAATFKTTHSARKSIYGTMNY